MSREFFEQVADAVIGFVPPDLGRPSTRLSAINVKVWFADSQRSDADGREHYEAQLLHDGSIEIGFHSEHRSVERNEAVLRALLDKEPSWRKAVGPEAEAGEFVGGRGGPWRRLSEVTARPPLDVEGALHVAERLAAYAEALEPLRPRS